MPRSFELSARYEAGVEAVHHVFSDREYWLARLADSGADTATLDAMTRRPDGSVEITTTQGVRREQLPALVTQFHPGDLTIVRGETWSAPADGRARAEVTGSVPGAPVSLTGHATLVPDGAGSRLDFEVSVQVNVPLVGGKIETFIGGRLTDLVAAEQRFTSAWLSRNDRP